MKIYSRNFVNENGDNVTVRVSEEVRHGMKGILIYMASPDSEMENFVTPQEAVELLEGLSKLLKPRRR
jgi:hypothetical protein